jgi:predicted nuclease of predicted toxin-antitoxin system
MRFLADQDVYATTIRFLSGLGHDVVPAASLGLAQAEDAELLRVAHERGRILVTRDRDFGGLVFVQGSGPGVIYLRILPSTQASVHAELERVLTLYTDQECKRRLLLWSRDAIEFASRDRHPGRSAEARRASKHKLDVCVADSTSSSRFDARQCCGCLWARVIRGASGRRGDRGRGCGPCRSAGSSPFPHASTG